MVEKVFCLLEITKIMEIMVRPLYFSEINGKNPSFNGVFFYVTMISSPSEFGENQSENHHILLEVLYCIHTKKLSCFKSDVEFDMNDILYELQNLHHF